MAKSAKKRLCAWAGCGKRFTPSVRTHLYHSVKCKNRASQSRLRMRAKQATELMMENQPYGA